MHSILWGIAAGSAHVASGPDHLAALAPLAVASRLRALWIGAAWGVGHGAGVLFLGTLGLLGRDLFRIECVHAWSELLVGVLLIWLGGWALLRCRRPAAATHDRGDSNCRQVHGAVGIGFLHGAAGLSHLFGVVPSLVMARADAAQYLVAYLLGAILAMALFGWVVGLLSRAGGARLLRSLFVVTGVAAVGLGCYWLGGAWQATLG